MFRPDPEILPSVAEPCYSRHSVEECVELFQNKGETANLKRTPGFGTSGV